MKILLSLLVILTFSAQAQGACFLGMGKSCKKNEKPAVDTEEDTETPKIIQLTCLPQLASPDHHGKYIEKVEIQINSAATADAPGSFIKGKIKIKLNSEFVNEMNQGDLKDFTEIHYQVDYREDIVLYVGEPDLVSGWHDNDVYSDHISEISLTPRDEEGPKVYEGRLFIHDAGFTGFRFGDEDNYLHCRENLGSLVEKETTGEALNP